MSKLMETGLVLEQHAIGTDIISLLLKAEQIAKQAVPGQFVSVYPDDGRHLLPRPISLCTVDPGQGMLRLVYRIAGEGTKLLSEKKEGESVRLMGPLGNGFPLDSRKALLIGGGIGLPPMVELGRVLVERGAKVTTAAGYRSERFLEEEFLANGELLIATEDGSCGTKGTVLDALAAHPVDCDTIFACGPTPMLRAVKAYALEQGIPCYLSLEERMACGIGACLGCVCQSKEIDEHTQVKKKRVCKDGPVFLSTEVEL